MRLYATNVRMRFPAGVSTRSSIPRADATEFTFECRILSLHAAFFELVMEIHIKQLTTNIMPKPRR